MIKKIVLVDCFDTLIHRREHPYEIVKRWAVCMNKLYPKVQAERIERDRFALMKSIKIDKAGIYLIYKEIAAKYFTEGLINSVDEFVRDSRKIEIYSEISSAYSDKKLLKHLKSLVKDGTEVCCVTDFHFSSEDMEEILNKVGINFLTKIFSSADYGATKHEGGLYKYILDELEIPARECVMIGDNYISDIKNARNIGINTIYLPHLIHQWRLKAIHKMGIQTRVHSLRNIGKEYWKDNSNYEEYSILFFTFCSRLYAKTSKTGSKKIVFLAREGYFLKILFDIYQEYCIPLDARMETQYFLCSRRAIHSVQKDKCKTDFFGDISVGNYFKSIGFSVDEINEILSETGINDDACVISDFPNSEEAKIINTNKKIVDAVQMRIASNNKAFEEYAKRFFEREEVNIVDVGWIGRMQQGISIFFPHLKTTGFYLGIYQNLFEEPFVERQGLIFNKDVKGNESAFFNIFRANIQFYEQLLGAPHGSACFYSLDSEGNVKVVQEWDAKEEWLYKTIISEVQDRIRIKFTSLCTRLLDDINCDVYEYNKINKQLALTMLRSTLIQSEKRLDFMDSCVEGFSQNFQQAMTGINFSARGVKINAVEIVFHPDRYVRYVAKIGHILKKKKLGFLGLVFMRLYYYYTRLACRI